MDNVMKTCQSPHRTGLSPTRAVLLCAALVLAVSGCDPSARRSESANEYLQRADFTVFVEQIDAGLKTYVDEQLAQSARATNLAQRFDAGLQHLPIEPRHAAALEQFYATRSFRPLFTQGRQLNATGVAVAQIMIAADAHALNPDDFHANEIREAIERTLSRDDLPLVQGELLLSEEDKEQLNVWLAEQVGDDGSLPDVKAALHAITLADDNSPLPELGRLVQSRIQATQPPVSAGSDLELLLADAFLRWSMTQRFNNLRYITTEMAHARGWRIFLDGEVYSTKQPGSPRAEPEVDPATLTDIDAKDVSLTLAVEYFHAAANSGDIEGALHRIAPPFEDYQRLVLAAKEYRQRIKQGGWSPLSGPVDMKIGASGPQVVELKKRLAAEDYFSGDTSNPEFTSELRDAMRHYQETHQLRTTGDLSQETFDSLNISVERRYAQILVTMDRWRETRIGEDVEGEYIVVNVPDFHAELWDKGERIHRFRVIVGATKRWRDDDGNLQVDGRTPLFSDELQYIVFNPYWNVPQSLWRRDYAEKIAEDPLWLEENGFEILQTSEGGQLLRQLPGPGNAMGLVKFLFPNEHDVYLHDTNRRNLFNANFRNFSYGCVRVDDALGFAALLTARDRGISVAAATRYINELLEQGEEQWTTLRTYVPIHIEYYTVRIDDDGYANFLADFHRYDAPLVEKKELEVQAYFDSLHSESAQLAGSKRSEQDTL